tara:strand:+ start:1339 stop:3078 length:1740 start_codon:yes stop_codon:yes gene_type:complete
MKNIFFLNDKSDYKFFINNDDKNNYFYPLNFKIFIYLNKKKIRNVIRPSSRESDLEKSIITLKRIEEKIENSNFFKSNLNEIEKETFLNLLHVTLSSCLETYYNIYQYKNIEKFYLRYDSKLHQSNNFDEIFKYISRYNIKYIENLHNLSEKNINKNFFFHKFINKIIFNKNNLKSCYLFSTNRYGFDKIIEYLKNNYQNIKIYKITPFSRYQIMANIVKFILRKEKSILDINFNTSKVVIDDLKIHQILNDVDEHVFKLIKDNLFSLLKRGVLYTASKYQSSKNILKIIKPTKIFLHHIRWYENLAVAYVANNMNIPVYLISHGSTPYNNNENVSYILKKHANGMSFSKFANFSVSLSPVSEKIINYNINNTKILRLNFLKIKNKNIYQNHRSINEIIILHAGTYKNYSPRLWIYENVYEYIVGLKNLINVVKNYKNVKLIIRVRGDQLSPQHEIINLLPKYKNIEFKIDGDFYYDLNRANLLVTYFSTTAEEAISIKKPVLLFGGTDRYKQIEGYNLLPDKNNSYPVYTASQTNLRNTLDSILKYHKQEHINDKEYKKLSWVNDFNNLNILFSSYEK